jgi:hypothetical protein
MVTEDEMQRSLSMLRAVQEGDTAVVAVVTKNGQSLCLSTYGLVPGHMVDIARSLLGDVQHRLEDEEGGDETPLYDQVSECLEILPDPNGDPEDDEDENEDDAA